MADWQTVEVVGMKRPAWLTKKVLIRGSAVLVIGGAVAGVIAIIYPLAWSGFGLDSTTNTERDGAGKVIKTIEIQQSGKTLWDWLQLTGTLAVPIAIAVLTYQFQQRDQARAKAQAEIERRQAQKQAEDYREQSEKQAQLEKDRAEAQAKLEWEIADTNRKEEALQAYFDRLSDLLVNKNLIAIATERAERQKLGETLDRDKQEMLDAAINVIRVRTLSILRRLGQDGERKGDVIRFLIEAEVIGKLKLNLSDADLRDAELYKADLRNAHLSNADLRNAHLSGADLNSANLSNAELYKADLSGADLNGADLNHANLNNASLDSTDLSNADLEYAYLGNTDFTSAHLNGAHLNGANLSGANFNKYADDSGTDLSSADLRYANLSKANFSYVDLSGANLSNAKNWTEAQLAAAKLCKTKLPAGCNLNPNRDCEALGISLDPPE